MDQASDSDSNNSSGSHSDTPPSSILQHLPASNGEEEDKPSQSNEDLNSSDDCVFVGYVKPRHQRTPEVITLLSSDLEADEGEEMVSPAMFARCVLPNVHILFYFLT